MNDLINVKFVVNGMLEGKPDARPRSILPIIFTIEVMFYFGISAAIVKVELTSKIGI